MSVIVIAETPGLDAEGYERIVKEQGRRVDERAAEFGRAVLAPATQRAGLTPSRPQVFPLHCAQTRSEA